MQVLFHRHTKGDSGNALFSSSALNLLILTGAGRPQAGCPLWGGRRGEIGDESPSSQKWCGITFPTTAARVWPQDALHNRQGAFHVLKRDFLLARAPTYTQSSHICTSSLVGWDHRIIECATRALELLVPCRYDPLCRRYYQKAVTLGWMTYLC